MNKKKEFYQERRKPTYCTSKLREVNEERRHPTNHQLRNLTTASNCLARL